MSLQNSNISPHINGTFIYMQITHAVGTDAPPYHHRGSLFCHDSGCYSPPDHERSSGHFARCCSPSMWNVLFYFILFASNFLPFYPNLVVNYTHIPPIPRAISFRFTACTLSLAAPNRIWRSLRNIRILQAVCTRLTAVIPGARGAGDTAI